MVARPPAVAGPGSGAPTLEQVARAAGVSRATVSRVVNGSPRVSPETLDAVTKAIADLGYTPNRAARALVTRRADSVAFVVPELGSRVFADPFFSLIIPGVMSALAGTELQLVLLLAQDPGDNHRLVRYLRSGHVDGALVASHHGEDAFVQDLSEGSLPVVFAGRPLLPPGTVAGRALPYIDADNVGGAQLATRHLYAVGRRRIATITGPLDMPAGVDRLEGWRIATHELGLPDGPVAHGDFTAAGGAAAMTALLTREPQVDAVFVASDLMASGALRVLHERGLRVPEDVAVVGHDDSIIARTTTPPLTSVRQPIEEMGRRMVDRLLEELAGAAGTDEPVILPTTLVERASA